LGYVLQAWPTVGLNWDATIEESSNLDGGDNFYQG
jgi:hypothetical protein